MLYWVSATRIMLYSTEHFPYYIMQLHLGEEPFSAQCPEIATSPHAFNEAFTQVTHPCINNQTK